MIRINKIIFFFLIFNAFNQLSAQPNTRLFPEFETDIYASSGRAENYKNIYNDILRNYYNKGRFESAISEISKNLNDFPNDIKDDVFFTLAKCYYKTENYYRSFIYFRNILADFPKSRLITGGAFEKTILKIIKIESEKSVNFTFTYPLKLYSLLKQANSNNTTLTAAERFISSRLTDKIKIPINLENIRITDYEQFKLTVVNQIWNTLIPADFWIREALILTNMVSTKQIENCYNYYSKDLLVKLAIKDAFGVQSIRYIGYGLIETTPADFFASLNLKLSNFLINNTDLYIYKEEF